MADKTSEKSGGGLGKFLFGGLAVVLVAGVGYVGYSQLTQSERLDEGMPVAEAVDDKVTPSPKPTQAASSGSALSEDCMSYSGAFRLDEKGAGARLLDAAGRGTPLSASGDAATDEMKRALEIIQAYDLETQCFVGRPNPRFRYWKTAAGEMPSGALAGEDCVPIDPATLSVKLRNGSYHVQSGTTSLMRFMTTANASKTVKTIRYYGATHVCYVGRPDASMIYIRN